LKPHFTLVVLVPCFNESKRLHLDTWSCYITAHPAFLFIFIDDGSSDQTQHVLQTLAANHQNIRVLHNRHNEGKASAVRSGMLYAAEACVFDAAGFIDADLSCPLSELDRFTAILNTNAAIDMVIGSRVQMLGKNINRNIFRHYIGRVIATFICKILDEPVYDTQCGLKLFRNNIASELMQEPFSSKWLFDVEILARYKIKYGSLKFKKRLLEIPVTEWKEMENSKLKFYQIFAIIYELIKINRTYFLSKTS